MALPKKYITKINVKYNDNTFETYDITTPMVVIPENEYEMLRIFYDKYYNTIEYIKMEL